MPETLNILQKWWSQITAAVVGLISGVTFVTTMRLELKRLRAEQKEAMAQLQSVRSHATGQGTEIIVLQNDMKSVGRTLDRLEQRSVRIEDKLDGFINKHIHVDR